MAPGESTDERDQRVAKLWESLGVPKDGRLDLNGLKKGFKKVDHRKFWVILLSLVTWSSPSESS